MLCDVWSQCRVRCCTLVSVKAPGGRVTCRPHLQSQSNTLQAPRAAPHAPAIAWHYSNSSGGHNTRWSRASVPPTPAGNPGVAGTSGCRHYRPRGGTEPGRLLPGSTHTEQRLPAGRPSTLRKPHHWPRVSSRPGAGAAAASTRNNTNPPCQVAPVAAPSPTAACACMRQQRLGSHAHA